MPGTEPLAYLLRKYLQDKLQIIKKHFKENLLKSWIYINRLLITALILFIKELGGGILILY